MSIPFLEFVGRRFHYELDKAQEEYDRAIGRMEDGEFERGFIAGLERGLYLIEDSRLRWGSDPLDLDGSGDSGEGSGDVSEGGGSSDGGSTGQGGGSDSGGQSQGGSPSGPGGGPSGDSGGPGLDMPLDAMTQ